MTNIEHKKHAHELESQVRSYVRSFPFTANEAKGATIYSDDGKAFLDFLSGAGALNYGHNNDFIKKAVISYLENDGILHGLDFATTAKNDFISTFNKYILNPRGLNYLFQFCGPTGTNAVEAAIKLARKVTQRINIISFTNGFHGMTLGALGITGNNYHKQGIPGTHSQNTTFMPYCGYSENVDDSIAYIRQYLKDNSSGVNLPAAIILECIQGEGGVNVASERWLRGIRKVCDEFDILLIADDIQMGCGRTGDFFSFEESGITPDIVLLSKSIGAYGLPMALLLFKPALDIWLPGQHNGTFRGHNLAFVAATEAIKFYWKNKKLSKSIKDKAKIVEKALKNIAKKHHKYDFEIRGRGLVWALENKEDNSFASKIQKECFSEGLIIENCGSKNQAIKILPSLTITKKELLKGLKILENACEYVIKKNSYNQANVLIYNNK